MEGRREGFWERGKGEGWVIGCGVSDGVEVMENVRGVE